MVSLSYRLISSDLWDIQMKLSTEQAARLKEK